MADVTITDLTSQAPGTNDVFPFSTAVSPSTYKASLAQIKTALAIPAAQIQSDWTQATIGALDYIKNKPTIPAAAASQQLARAWVNFNGTGASSANQNVYSSYNVSSVYKISEGCYGINFTAGVFANGNYCCTGVVSMPGGCATTLHINTNANFNLVTPTATSMTILAHCATQGNRSPAYVSLVYYA